MLQVAGGVDDVGGEDEIVARRVDALVGGGFLDVEGGIFDERVVGETFLRRGDEGGAIVGEGELGAVRGENREDPFG